MAEVLHVLLFTVMDIYIRGTKMYVSPIQYKYLYCQSRGPALTGRKINMTLIQ